MSKDRNMSYWLLMMKLTHLYTPAHTATPAGQCVPPFTCSASCQMLWNFEKCLCFNIISYCEKCKIIKCYFCRTSRRSLIRHGGWWASGYSVEMVMAEGTAVLRRNRPGTKAKVRVYHKELLIVALKKHQRSCELHCFKRVVFCPSVYTSIACFQTTHDGPDLEMLS